MTSEQGSPIRHQTTPPLRRLIRRGDANALLEQTLALLPNGASISLVDANGLVYLGQPLADVPSLAATISHDAGQWDGDLWIRGLWMDGALLGAIAATVPTSDLADDTRLFCAKLLDNLHLSLSLLAQRARDTHTIANETLERYREINLLYRLGATISTSLDPVAIAERVLSELQHTVRAGPGVVLFVRQADGEAGVYALDELDMSATCGHEASVLALCTLAADAIADSLATGQTLIVSPADAMQTHGIISILCAPLRAQENCLGLMLLGRVDDQGEFTAGDGKLVTALAAHLAYALETARLHQDEVERERFDRELAISRAIQMSLLPAHAPSAPGWQFAASYRPAREVGGDHYDFVSLPDRPASLGIVIADVTGKGMPAALFMAFSRTVIRLESMHGQGPATILERANQFIAQEVGSRLFLSAFCANLDMESGYLRFANAGHDWPLWSRHGMEQICELDASGTVLGAFHNLKFEEQMVRLEPGDAVVLFTDGVTEARNEVGEFFGESRLRQAITAHTEKSAQGLADSILQAVDAFTGTREQNDDLTLVVIQREVAIVKP
ncbi:MAG: SpoIIE family protein phosphatase [Caldilineaceae bacterium]|nr:SpoIIE family protein phosphatase [Caldilineaceae bacterium]